MARFLKGSPEAYAWARKMRQKKEEKNPEVLAPEAPDFIIDIIEKYFPGKEYKILNRDNDYFVEITISEAQKVINPGVITPHGESKERTITEKDIRSFSASKLTAQIETENWCRKIKDNLEGKKTESRAVGLNTTMGIREAMKQPIEEKKLPPELGSDSKHFFRER